MNNYGEELVKLRVFNCEAEKATHSFPCLLKYYSMEEGKIPKLNEIVKITGVLSIYEPKAGEKCSVTNEANEDFDAIDNYNFIYPDWLIPRVHVLQSETVSAASISTASLEKLNDVSDEEVKESSTCFLNMLTSLLNYDNDAA